MKNFIQPGKNLTLTAPYDVVSGAGAQVGSIFGVATKTIASGAEGEFATEGVFELKKIESQAWTVGQKIFWDNTEKECTSVAGANLLIGVATEIAASGASLILGKVKLIPLGESEATNMSQAANQADVATADGSDAGTTQTLANALKAAHNALLAKLKAAGIMVDD